MLVLVLIESASGYAAGSIAENCCYLAGRSVLSEYQKDVYKRYGLLYLRADEPQLEKMAEFYINSNLEVKNGIVKPVLKELSVDTSSYSGLSYENVLPQIKVLGAAIAADRLLTEDNISGLISMLKDGGETVNKDSSSVLSTLKSLSRKPKTEYDENGEKIPESSESKSRRRQARELKDRYNEAVNPIFGEIEAEKDIKSYKLSNLPTRIMGIGKSSALTYSGGLLKFNPDAVLQAVYLAEVCSVYVEPMEDTCLEGELEYILFGNLSDAENIKSARSALYTLRLGMNLAEIYKNSAKMAEYNAIAAASFPMIPTPVTVFVLAFCDASVQSKTDLGTLLSGGKVPVIKGTGFGTYRDYLLLMVSTMDEQTRLLRFFDMVQLNTVHKDEGIFSFRNYCCGFDLKAEFSKNVYMPLNFSGGQKADKRYREIEQSHVYK